MSGDVLAVAEHRRGQLREVSYELITAGRDLADATDGDLHVAVIGGDVEGFAERLDREGVDVVHTVAEGEEFEPDVSVPVTTTLVGRLDPDAVLMPHSADGLDYAPAVATRLSAPLVTDVTGLAVDEALSVTRERYDAKVESTVTVATEDRPVALTVRPGAWRPAEDPGEADVEATEVAAAAGTRRRTARGFEEVGGEVDLRDATVVVAVGRGVADEATLESIEAFADDIGASLAATRPVVDRGWLPASRQVGQSGVSVTPDVYLALGLSGAPRHLVGVTDAETVVAVDTDPDARIFGIADFGVVADLEAVVPELRERFGE